MLKVYAYAKCDTCRKALKFLRARKIIFQEIAIRETPPSQKELKAMLNARGEIRKLFNRSGADYKALGLSSKLAAMSEAEAIGLLASNGNLIRRPFVSGDGVNLAGFDEVEWRSAFS